MLWSSDSWIFPMYIQVVIFSKAFVDADTGQELQVVFTSNVRTGEKKNSVTWAMMWFLVPRPACLSISESCWSPGVFYTTHSRAGVSNVIRKGPVWAQVFIPTRQEPNLSLLKATLNWLNTWGQVWLLLDLDWKPAPTLALSGSPWTPLV